jgi:hypothetical protein
MKLTPILIGLLLICSVFILPAIAAENGESLKIYDKDGNVVNRTGHESASHDEENKITANDDNKNSETGSSDINGVWGIQQSDAGWSDLVNINTLGGVYMGFTPFRNMSLISISIAGGLALTFLIVGIFGLLIWAGIGAAHPNIRRGRDMIRGAQGKIVALGIIFALAFFMIIVIFFTLSIFGKVIVMMA